MRFERLFTTESAMYAEAIKLYGISFPFHEQREEGSQTEIMSNREYHFDLVYDENEFVGLILYWESESIIYVEHLCILPSMRNKKYGYRILECLNEMGKTVILEIDPPVDEISIRRKSFYERANYKANKYEHFHPAYHTGYSDHRLVVMSFPERLTSKQYAEFAEYLKTVVMGSRS